MIKIAFSIGFFLIFWTIRAQEPIPKDSLPTIEIAPMDSLPPEGNSTPLTLEYIPADETPELIIDRLSCLQNIIHLTYNEKVQAFIDYFTIRDREYTRMVQRRKELYFPLFEKYLKQYNLPDELKYLSIIESGLNPRAISRARAVGLWQFMSGTGRYFGLRSDWYIDDRMDPEKSTDAACRYLSQLHSFFDDWQLALAAYNSGPGTVRWAVRKSGYKKTFWEVYPFLPRETRAYVPQFIAIIYALNHTEEHNLVEIAREQIPIHDTLTVKQFLNFETFAQLTGTCLEDLQRLNPSFQRNAVPDNGKHHIIKIPLYAKVALQLNRSTILDSSSRVGKMELETIAKNISSSTYGKELVIYNIRSGDVLSTIAQRHGIRVDDIKIWNNLNSNYIHPGRKLNLWISPVNNAAAKTASISIPADAKTYIVQPGDTLWDISKRLQGISIDKIKSLNNLKSNKLQPGQKLIIG